MVRRRERPTLAGDHERPLAAVASCGTNHRATQTDPAG